MKISYLLSLLLILPSTMAFVPFSADRSSMSTARHVFGDDHFDMEELRQRISQESSPQLLNLNVKTRPPYQVHVILFNPHSDDEGMHTIEYPKGSGNNVILAFEDQNDCNLFSEHLKAQQFHDPTVRCCRIVDLLFVIHSVLTLSHSHILAQPQKLKLKTLQAYCESLGVFVQVVPKGTKLIPPSQNVQHFGHDPNLQAEKRALGYVFEMSSDAVEHDAGVIVEDEFASWE